MAQATMPVPEFAGVHGTVTVNLPSPKRCFGFPQAGDARSAEQRAPDPLAGNQESVNPSQQHAFKMTCRPMTSVPFSV
jgi:hypothetical protein